MKNLLLASLVTLSMNAFAQSYLVMDNGIIVTTDNAGFTYDLGHFAYPMKVTTKGGNYFVEEGGILATVDESGIFYRKYEVIPEKIKGKGINYILSEDGVLITVDNRGMAKTLTGEHLKHAKNFGGNYFVVVNPEKPEMAEIFVVKEDGSYEKSALELKLKEIVAFGGRYFMTNRGVLHTIADDGSISAQPNMRVGLLNKRGGNYFTDSSNIIFTVSEDGQLKLPGLPLSLKVKDIAKLGSNYFLDLQGRLFVVDKDGNIWERQMRDHDFKHAKIISL